MEGNKGNKTYTHLQCVDNVFPILKLNNMKTKIDRRVPQTVC